MHEAEQMTRSPKQWPDAGALSAFTCAVALACSDHGSSAKGFVDATVGSTPLTHPCDLPGSIQFTSRGVVVVPGGPSGADLSYLHLPQGFCVHPYGVIANVRQMRFAPGGELFVSSPSRGTTSGGLNGHAAIVLMPDDNHDGTADAILTFLSDLPSTQGLLFANDRLYYQDSTRIMSMPYQLGDRVPRAPATAMANITIFQATEHWPKTLDISDDGTIYVGNGGDQDEVCDPTRPFRGGILELDGSEGGTPVAKGLRNPIDVRCARGNDRCFALELGLDHSASEGGREKLIPIRQGDDWGFPCCATQNVPFEGLDEAEAAVCADVAPDADTFLIGDTPFGIEFEQGRWPAPWKKEAFIAMHGAAGGDGRPWAGARIVAIAMDPTTGLPLPSTDALGADIGAMTDFATGWDDGTLEHGRPTAIAFSDDGRLFVGDDQKGVIFWIAAMTQ